MRHLLSCTEPTLERHPGRGEAFAWFIVAVLAAIYWFDWVLLKSSAWPDDTRRHYYVYASTLLVVLPLSLATCALFHVARDVLLQKNQNFLPSVISLQTAFWIWVWTRPEDSLLTPELELQIRWALPALVLVAVGLAHASGPKRRRGWSFVQTLVFPSLPIVGLVFLWHFKGEDPVKRSTIVLLAILALLLAAPVIRGRSKVSAPRDHWDTAFSVFLVLVIVPTALDINYLHQDFFLGPVNEVLAGRSMLVDVNCQYGVGVIYFLAATFKLFLLKPHYIPFTVLLVTLTTLQFLLSYWIIRRIFQSRLLAVGCLIAMVVLGRIGFYHVDGIVFPSVGPLRFGFPLLVLAAGFLRRTRPSGSRRWAWVEASLLGVASIWSVESFVYCLSAYGCSTVAEAWAVRASLFDFGSRLVRSALGPMIAIFAAAAALTLLTLARSRELPHLGQYLSYVTLYSTTSIASWDLAVWTPWILVPCMTCLSLLATALRTHARRDLDAGHLFIAGLAGASAAEFSYFIMRSHPNNLTHIAAPVVVLLFYWLDQSWKGKSHGCTARWTALPVAFLILIGLGWSSLGTIWTFLDRSLLVWTVREAGGLIDGEPIPIPDLYAHLWTPPPSSPRAAAHLRLAAKYAAKQREIPAMSPDAVEFYALAGRRDPFPIGCVTEDALLPGYFDKMAAAPLPLKLGEVLLITDDAHGGLDGPPVEIESDLQPLVAQIKLHYKLQPLEHDDDTGVWAARLAPSGLAEADGVPKL